MFSGGDTVTMPAPQPAPSFCTVVWEEEPTQTENLVGNLVICSLKQGRTSQPCATGLCVPNGVGPSNTCCSDPMFSLMDAPPYTQKQKSPANGEG